MQVNVPQTKDAAGVAVNIFRFFPSYNVGEGLIALTTVAYSNSVLGTKLNPFSFAYAGTYASRLPINWSMAKALYLFEFDSFLLCFSISRVFLYDIDQAVTLFSCPRKQWASLRWCC